MAMEIFYTLKGEKNTRKWYQYKTDVPGSFLTWMAFMYNTERKYLPSLPDPCPMLEASPSYHSRFAFSPIFDKRPEGYPLLQEVWDLMYSPKLTPEERLTMQSMMDYACFRPEDVSVVVGSWLKVAMDLSPLSMSAFSVLANRCQTLVTDIEGVELVCINWNSVNLFNWNFSANDSKFYDFMLDVRVVEAALGDKEVKSEK